MCSNIRCINATGLILHTVKIGISLRPVGMIRGSDARPRPTYKPLQKYHLSHEECVGREGEVDVESQSASIKWYAPVVERNPRMPTGS